MNKEKKVEYGEQTFYFQLNRKEEKPKLHVYSGDKKTDIVFVFDYSLPISKGYITRLLDYYFKNSQLEEAIFSVEDNSL